MRDRWILLIMSAAVGIPLGACSGEDDPRDAGSADVLAFDCLLEGDACAPAYDGAMCGPPFIGVPVDENRSCIDRSRRITIGCQLPMGGGSLVTTCYTYEGPSGSGVALMPLAADELARTPITATWCSEELRNEVSGYPECP